MQFWDLNNNIEVSYSDIEIDGQKLFIDVNDATDMRWLLGHGYTPIIDEGYSEIPYHVTQSKVVVDGNQAERQYIYIPQFDDFIRDYTKQLEVGGFHMIVDDFDVFIDTSEGSQLKMAGGLLQEMMRNDLTAPVEYFVSGTTEIMEITSGQFIQIAQAIGEHVRKVLKIKNAVQIVAANGGYNTLEEVQDDIDGRMAQE